jgi:hypothetical protein
MREKKNKEQDILEDLSISIDGIGEEDLNCRGPEQEEEALPESAAYLTSGMVVGITEADYIDIEMRLTRSMSEGAIKLRSGKGVICLRNIELLIRG